MRTQNIMVQVNDDDDDDNDSDNVCSDGDEYDSIYCVCVPSPIFDFVNWYENNRKKSIQIHLH